MYFFLGGGGKQLFCTLQTWPTNFIESPKKFNFYLRRLCFSSDSSKLYFYSRNCVQTRDTSFRALKTCRGQKTSPGFRDGTGTCFRWRPFYDAKKGHYY